MIQAPFGSTTPAWTGLPLPAFTWPQTPAPLVGQPLPAQTMQSSAPMPPSAFGWGGGPAITFPPLSTSLSLPDGVTAPTLMAAIAMRRGLPQGPTNDHDVEELIYDALEVFPGTGDVEVRCEGGRVTLTGSVPHKRIKRDVGELAWAIPAINDVTNSVSITGRRRSRPIGGREPETQASGQSRKQS